MNIKNDFSLIFLIIIGKSIKIIFSNFWKMYNFQSSGTINLRNFLINLSCLFVYLCACLWLDCLVNFALYITLITVITGIIILDWLTSIDLTVCVCVRMKVNAHVWTEQSERVFRHLFAQLCQDVNEAEQAASMISTLCDDDDAARRAFLELFYSND